MKILTEVEYQAALKEVEAYGINVPKTGSAAYLRLYELFDAIERHETLLRQSMPVVWVPQPGQSYRLWND